MNLKFNSISKMDTGYLSCKISRTKIPKRNVCKSDVLRFLDMILEAANISTSVAQVDGLCMSVLARYSSMVS